MRRGLESELLLAFEMMEEAALGEAGIVADVVDRRGRVREIYNLDYFKPGWVLEDVQLLLEEADGGSEKRGDRAK